jgi:hypothetical protein
MAGGSIKNSVCGVSFYSGMFMMNAGSEISNNSCGISSQGTANAEILMNGGRISNNSGSGVDIARSVTSGSNAHFTMNGGEISENGAGGVYIYNCSFTMNGGSIINNTGIIEINQNDLADAYQSGIHVVGGYLELNGDVTISGNTVNGFPANISTNLAHWGYTSYVLDNTSRYPPDPSTGFFY